MAKHNLTDQSQPEDTGVTTHALLLEERARANAEKEFHDLLDAAPDAVLEIDSKGRIVRANAAVYELFGYTPEELHEQPVEILIPEELRGGHLRHREGYARAPTKRPMGSGIDLYARRKDGTRFPVDIVLSPIRLEGTIHTAVIVRNIAHRKQEEVVLRDARRQAESANRAKSEFLASMSHELRSPLNTIMGYTQLLAEETVGPLNETQRRYVGNIEKDSQHLRDLINDILDISKIEAGQLDLNHEPFSLDPLINEVITMMRTMAKDRNVELRHETPTGITIVGDLIRTKQILINLVNNAVKFTPSGGGVHVSCAKAKGQVAITVADTGIGIPEEHLDAIFDRFHQVSSTTKGVKEGTGLGLAITKKLIEQMGGEIWVESAVGKGSRFTFTIEGWFAPTTGGAKVLVVEDEPRSAQLLQDYLSPEGYSIAVCHSVQQALVEIEAQRPAAILLDLFMPRQAEDGLHLLKVLKGAAETRNIPVIVVSVLEPAGSPALTIGAAAHLTKPVHKQELLQALRKVIPTNADGVSG